LRLFSFCRACSAWVDELIHPDARRSPTERVRHHDFLARQIIAAGTIIVGAPFWLVAFGAPTPAQSLIYFLAQTPLVSAIFLSRQGNLLVAQTLSIVGTLATAGAALMLADGTMPLAVALVAVSILEIIGAPRLAPLFLMVAGLAPAAAYAAGGAFSGATELHPGAAIPLAMLSLYAVAMIVELRRIETRRYTLDAHRGHELRLLRLVADGAILRLDARAHVVGIEGEPRVVGGLSSSAMIGDGLFGRVHIADRPEFLRRLSEMRVGDAASDFAAAWRFRLDVGCAAPGVGRGETVFRVFEARLQKDAGASAADDTVIFFLRDATVEREAEAARAETARALENAEADKTRFLANVGHELRTPLNAIIGFSEILANPALEPVDATQRREYAEIVNVSGQHLLAVVDSMLDLSKIEAGGMTIAPEKFSIVQLVEECRRMLRLQAGRAGVSLFFDPPRDAGEILADRRACGQILINLLANAVKFTPAGGSVRVTLARAGRDCLIRVQDTGIGVDAADLARLGRPFFQARAGREVAAAGAGLGLSIVCGLVGLHGGAITIESGMRQGTTVIIRLPFDGPAQPSAGAAKIETIVRHGPAFDAAMPRETVKKIA